MKIAVARQPPATSASHLRTPSAPGRISLSFKGACTRRHENSHRFSPVICSGRYFSSRHAKFIPSRQTRQTRGYSVRGWWQATNCPGATARVPGISSLHYGPLGKRVRNRQTEGGEIGDGGLANRHGFGGRTSGSGTGRLDQERGIGCDGFAKNKCPGRAGPSPGAVREINHRDAVTQRFPKTTARVVSDEQPASSQNAPSSLQQMRIWEADGKSSEETGSSQTMTSGRDDHQCTRNEMRWH